MGSETGRMALKTGGSHDQSSKGFTAKIALAKKVISARVGKREVKWGLAAKIFGPCI